PRQPRRLIRRPFLPRFPIVPPIRRLKLLPRLRRIPRLTVRLPLLQARRLIRAPPPRPLRPRLRPQSPLRSPIARLPLLPTPRPTAQPPPQPRPLRIHQPQLSPQRQLVLLVALGVKQLRGQGRLALAAPFFKGKLCLNQVK